MPIFCSGCFCCGKYFRAENMSGKRCNTMNERVESSCFNIQLKNLEKNVLVHRLILLEKYRYICVLHFRQKFFVQAKQINIKK